MKAAAATIRSTRRSGISAKSGYEYGGEWDDEFGVDARAESFRRAFKALIKVASQQERVVLRAIAQLKAGQPLNWEAVARDLGKTSGAVKTQVRRAAA